MPEIDKITTAVQSLTERVKNSNGRLDEIVCRMDSNLSRLLGSIPPTNGGDAKVDKAEPECDFSKLDRQVCRSNELLSRLDEQVGRLEKV